MTDSSEKFSLISKDNFLTRVRDSFWKLAIIESTKLYGSRNDQYRIELVIDQMLFNHKYAEWKTKIPKIDLKKFQNHLNSNDVQTNMKKLKEIRNQYYAHKDENPDHNIYEIKFYYIDFAFLLRTAELIISELMIKIFEPSFTFSPYDGIDVDSFLNNYMESVNALSLLKLKGLKLNPQ